LTPDETFELIRIFVLVLAFITLILIFLYISYEKTEAT